MPTNRYFTLPLLLIVTAWGCDNPTPIGDGGASSESPTHAAPQTTPDSVEQHSDANRLGDDVPTDWVPFSRHGFELWMPDSYEYIEMLSPDSFCGAFESEGVFIVFDFGWYSDLTKHNRNKPNKQEAMVTLDNEQGFIWRYTDNGDEPYLVDRRKRPLMKQVLLLNVPKIGDTDNGLWIRARHQEDLPDKEQELDRVLRSVKFLSTK